MITGELKSQVDNVWNASWSGGISNPLVVIEQITYLLFLRRLDDAYTLQVNSASLRAQTSSVLANVKTSAHGTTRIDGAGITQTRVQTAPLDLQQEYADGVGAVEDLKIKHRAQLTELDITRPRDVLCNQIGYRE